MSLHELIKDRYAAKLELLCSRKAGFENTSGSPRERNLGTCPLEEFSNEGYLSGIRGDKKPLITAGPY